jgi:hypothetical protein
MSEMENKNNETTEMNQNDQTQQAADQQNTATTAEDKSEKVGFVQKCKNFAKTKAIPAAKFVGKGLVKGATVAGGALAMAYFIGAAAGGYAAAKGKASEESTDQEQSSNNAEAEKPADDQKDDVQVSLNENNVQVETTIE